MPMRRYEIRCEYGLGDCELYKAADKDDPEALLEGVAMSGLVGVLRQLGDLAEFAAEIFHDLHEEVMATAARGHDLMARVQQLEAEIPSIEKAFLSQTNQSPFFNNPGVDWRANLRMEHNLITRGDLPRFVMDSYEECRGPPRLFLLDKFDVAGAGACLKRYTDPSFFKVEAAPSDISTIEVQREKKVRKAKKKAARWRNGETPEVAPASHPKLLQLFLEERVENGHSDPARLVKLKRRHLNGSQFDINSGRSYMEKFVATPSPENKMVCADSAHSPLRLTFDNPGDSGLDIHEINMVSPVKESAQERATMFLPVVVEQDASEACSDELDEENFDRAIVKVPDPVSEADTDESSSAIAVNADDKAEGSADGVHSDDMNSEIENYMDALTTMDSEIETDNEYKLKMDGALKIVEKNDREYDTNQDHMDVQGNFSDSQSIGNLSLSYDGNSSVRRGQGSFSCSDSLSQLAENAASDSEGPTKTSSLTESHATELIASPPESSDRVVETEGTEPSGRAESADACFKAGKMPDPGETSCSSCPLDSKTADPRSDLTITDITRVEFVNFYLGNSSSQDSLVAVSSESHAMPEFDREDQNVLLDSLMHTSTSEEVDIHKAADNFVGDEDNNEEKDFTEEKIDTLPPIMTPSNEQLPCSTSTEPETNSLVTFSPETLDVVRPENLYFVVNPPIPLTDVNARNSELIADSAKSDERKGLERLGATVDALQGEINSEREVPIPLSEDRINLQQACGLLDGMEMVASPCEEVTDVASFKEAILSAVPLDTKDEEEETVRFANKVYGLTGKAVLSEQTDFSELESSDHTFSNNEVAGVLAGEDAAPCAASATYVTNICANNLASLTSDVLSPSSDDLLDVQQSISGSKVPQVGELGHETVSPECLAQLEALQEVKEDRSLAITNYSLHKSDSVDDHSMLNEDLFVTEAPLSETDQDRVVDKGASSAGQGNWDVVPETISEIKSDENGLEVVSSSLPLADPSAEHSVHKQNEQITASNLPSLVGANSRSLGIEESVSSGEESAELQLHQLREQSSEENEPRSSSELLGIAASVSSTGHLLDFHPKQIEVPGDNDEAKSFDVPVRPSGSGSEGLPSQAPLLQPSDDNLKSLPFTFAFPNSGLQFEATDVTLDDVPPLPPLPPMQWRMGKFQPASVILEREGLDQTPEASSLVQSCTLPHGLAFSENIESSVPSTHYPIKDSIGQQQLSTPPYVDVQQTMNDDDAGDGRHAGFNLAEPQLSSPFFTSPEVLNEKSEFSELEYDQEKKQSAPNPPSIESPVPPEPISPGDPVSLNDLQAPPPVVSEIPEAHSQNLVEEEVIAPHTSMEKLRQVEHQAPDDPMTSQGETTWSPSTLALPPAYGVGKLNGSKLPLPRNPLIVAVAAHDKSKLRKVAERVRPQLVPKLEERDTLLEQIRTKSFNLKPASVTRPVVQAMPGPKTNLRVAAILEKANAIRQALAGSDEEDSDSWSDS